MANSLHYDGTDLSTTAYSLTILKQHIGAYTTVNVDVQAIPFTSGVAQYMGTNPKAFSVECLIDSTSATHLTTCLDNLTLLFHAQTDKSLRFDDWYPARWWTARYTGGLEAVTLLGSYKAQVTLQFVAADPVAFSTTFNEPDLFSIPASPTSFDVDSTSNILDGNTYSLPTWILIPTAQSSNITIVNETLSTSFTWASTLHLGVWLIISGTAWGVVTSIDSGASYTVSMANVSGTFPRLLCGRTNIMTVTNFTGQIAMTYYGRYL